MQIRTEGTDLPGSSCGPSPDVPEGYRNIRVGVQRGNRREELLGTATLFRRAKLWLDGVPQETLSRAARQGQLVGRLRLTDVKGNPLCAAVRPPLIEGSCPE